MIPADKLAGLSDEVAQQVWRLWERAVAGELTRDMALDLSETLVQLGRAQAEQLARLVYELERSDALGASAQAVKVPAETIPDRLRDALVKATAELELAPMRASRLAGGETGRAFQRWTDRALQSDDMARGYIRELNAGACELCQWLYKDGHIYPAGQSMHQHKGCQCRQRTVWDRNIKPQSRRKRRLRRALA